MKKILFYVIAILSLTACGSRPPPPADIVPVGNGVYMSSAVSAISYQKTVTKAMRDASNYCKEKGKESEIMQTERPASGIFEVIVYFKCT